MPRTHAGLPSPKPEPSRRSLHKQLLPGLAACSLLSLFALPHVAAQVSKSKSVQKYADGGPGSTPIVSITAGGPITVTTPLPANPKDVLTERYSNARAGAYNQETDLNLTNVPTQTSTTAPYFGKKITYTVDGLIYGQPLYVQSLPVTNSNGLITTHSNGVVFVATNNNSVYAFDANDNSGSNGGPLWRVNFNSPGVNATPTQGNDVTSAFGLPQSDIQPLIGIVGSPVIDPASGTLYVVARTTEYNSFVHRLHAIDIRTGQEKVNSPALVGQYQDTITGVVSPITVQGDGDDRLVRGNTNFVYFDLLNENQRAALTLVNGVVYVAYGSFDSSPPYHGWMFGFNTANLLARPSVFCTTPNNIPDQGGFGFYPQPTQGGIDMSGVGPASDGTRLFFTTGLGALPQNPVDPREYVQSVLRLPTPIQEAPTADFGIFQPNAATNPTGGPLDDYINLSVAQFDIGTGGLALFNNSLIPGHSNTMVTAGQQGHIYLLDREPTGGILTAVNTILPTPDLLGANYGAPTVFTDNTGQTRVFFHASGDAVRSFNLTNTEPYLTSYAIGTAAGANQNNPLNYDYPGAQTVVSSKPDLSQGILWDVESAPVISRTGGGITTQTHYAVLHAYDTATLTEQYNSTLKGGGIDSIGNYVKFTQPLAAGGKVFVTAGVPSQFDPGGSTTYPQGRLVIFGLINPAQRPPTAGQGTRYQLSGPVGWQASSGGIFPVGPLNLLTGFPQFVGTLEVNRAYSYSLTAIDSNNKPQAITGNVNLQLIDQFTGRKISMGAVTFNKQSNVVFSKTITQQGLFIMQALDSSGNPSQYFPNIGDVPYVQVVGATNIGFDRFNLRMPVTARDGQLTTVTVAPVTNNGFPVNVRTTVTIYDTLPAGGQDYSLPFDNDPTDGFGILNTPAYEPTMPRGVHTLSPTPHSTALLGTLNFAYELQYGIADFALTPGIPIGIYDDGGFTREGKLGSTYPNVNGSGTYPCVFHGVGQHVVIVYDGVAGIMTTGVINVTP